MPPSMRTLFVIAFLFISSLGFSQEGVEVKGNKVTIKESAPVWPGCEDSKSQKECFNKKLMTHIKENYKYPRTESGEFIRGKSTAAFEVNEKGEIEILSIEGKNDAINKAVREMLLKAPKMHPGSRGGKPVSIKYTVPLNL